MYKSNPDRLSKIKNLRRQGLTIDKIAAATGYPKSSVGYYVNRYCGGRLRIQKPSGALSVEPETRQVIRMVESDSKIDRVEAYMQSLEKTERLSPQDVLDRKRIGDPLVEEIILDMFARDPETLHLRLNLLEKLIRLAPFLRINLDHIRDMIQLQMGQKPKE
jgi:hypothetical protein